MKYKRFLITGGSGFIGTNLIDELLSQKCQVKNIDISAPKKSNHFSIWSRIDVMDKVKLENAILEFDPEVIIHLAAVTDLNGNSSEYYRVNTEGTQNLIDVVANLKTLSKVVFTSSMYVCKPGYIPKLFSDYMPHTAYGQSKVEGEKIVNAITESKYEWVIIRPTSIWGPWFEIPYIDFFRVVFERKYFIFRKACTKTYGFIDNTVYQILKLVESDKVHGRTFYLGDNPPIPISDWAEEISFQMNKGKLLRLPYWVVWSAAKTGDLMKVFGIRFPLTTFRLRNMTTNNIIPLKEIYEIAGDLPVSRLKGVEKTINWLANHKGYKIDSFIEVKIPSITELKKFEQDKSFV